MMHDSRQDKEKVAARQGTKEKMNFRVLATSLFLIALIFTGLYFFFLASPSGENSSVETPAGAGTSQPRSTAAIAP